MEGLRNYFFVAFTYYSGGVEFYRNWYNGETIKDSDGNYWGVKNVFGGADDQIIEFAAIPEIQGVRV